MERITAAEQRKSQTYMPLTEMMKQGALKRLKGIQVNIRYNLSRKNKSGFLSKNFPTLNFFRNSKLNNIIKFNS